MTTPAMQAKTERNRGWFSNMPFIQGRPGERRGRRGEEGYGNRGVNKKDGGREETE